MPLQQHWGGTDTEIVSLKLYTRTLRHIFFHTEYFYLPFTRNRPGYAGNAHVVLGKLDMDVSRKSDLAVYADTRCELKQ